MENRYEIDPVFEPFKGITVPLGLMLLRVFVGLLSMIRSTVASIPALAASFAQLNAWQQPETTGVLLTLLFVQIALILLLAVEIALFYRRKRAFVILYFVIAAIEVLNLLLGGNTMAYMALLVEAVFCAYALSSKNVAVRFRFYTPLSRMALDAYAAKNDVGRAEGVLRELEETAKQSWRGEIAPEEFARRKAELLKRL